jgi:transposase
MVEGTLGSHHKDGTTKMDDFIMKVAGIDTGKAWLDVAVSEDGTTFQVPNDAPGWQQLADDLVSAGVGRIGIEASGGYEIGVVQALRHAGLTIEVYQPLQIKLFARLQLRRAKNDRLDAQLIAAFTASHFHDHPSIDPRYQGFADHLGFIEQVEQDLARLKTRLEHQRVPRLADMIGADIKALTSRRNAERRRLQAELRRHPDIARRLDLVLSIEGIGLPTALTLIVRMPELGRLSREEVASLAGVAPFDCDSGQRRGQRHIAGGRAQVRTALYAAALPAAFRWNPALIRLYKRLTAAGKAHKQALVACARKLLIFANTVLTRDEPWLPQNSQT